MRFHPWMRLLLLLRGAMQLRKPSLLLTLQIAHFNAPPLVAAAAGSGFGCTAAFGTAKRVSWKVLRRPNLCQIPGAKTARKQAPQSLSLATLACLPMTIKAPTANGKDATAVGSHKRNTTTQSLRDLDPSTQKAMILCVPMVQKQRKASSNWLQPRETVF